MLVARSGSRQACARLYDRYAGLVRAVAYDRCGDRQAANELAQESFLRAFRHLDRLRDPARFLPWLIQIARLVASESHRAEQRQRRIIAASDASQRGQPDPADGLELQELQERVIQLPEPDRTAIRLFYLCEHSADQARGVLGLSRSGFYKVLNRAKQTLRQQLDPAPGAEA